MYPDKEHCNQRLEIVRLQLEALYRDHKELNKTIAKLEKEKGILHNLIDIYSLEHSL